MNKKNMNPDASLGILERVGYGAGDFSCNLIYASISAFLLFYYTNVIGVSAAVAGSIMAFSKLLDGFSDLAMGFIVDRTHSKHGKGRVWLLRMAVPYALAAVVLFSVPTGGSIMFKTIYIFISYNLVSTVAYTAINIPYSTMNALITTNQYERGLLGTFRMILSTAGTMFVNTFTLKLVGFFGNGNQMDATAWTKTYVVYGIMSIALFLFTFYTTTERVIESESEKENVPMLTGIKSLLKNKYWIYMALAIFLMFFMMTTFYSTGMYYVQVTFGDTNYFGNISNAMTIAQIATMFGAAIFVKKFGKRNTMLMGNIILVLGFLMTAIVGNNYVLVLISNVIKGIGAGFGAAVMFGMLSDTIEYGEWKTGVRVAGLANAASSFGMKVGSGVGSAVLGWVLTIGGYNATAAIQSPSAVTAINTLYSYIPMVCMLLCAVFMYFYKLDKEFPQIIQELRERKK